MSKSYCDFFPATRFFIIKSKKLTLLDDISFAKFAMNNYNFNALNGSERISYKAYYSKFFIANWIHSSLKALMNRFTKTS